ncbi:MAG: cbb3-type cytochrome c oxidase subunit I, partial [Rhodospirillales bacterium]|nr:cbb3-type cytochrome c oxidase subunit I [Rhodospirillales bacterium]
WLRKAPWGNPVFSGMFLSLVLFGFLGGITGVTMGVEQINIIIHNTIYVPGHFHGTVATGTTLAFMALTYFLIPTLFRRSLAFPTMAKWQPYVFGIGMGMAALFMMGAGTLGVSRRHWDIAFTDAALKFNYPQAAWLMMGLAGIFGVMAAIGGAMFCLVAVGSLLWGEKLSMEPAPAPAAGAAKPAVASHGDAGTFTVPGTFTLAMVFLIAFVLYYFVNWKYLASTWGLS